MGGTLDSMVIVASCAKTTRRGNRERVRLDKVLIPFELRLRGFIDIFVFAHELHANNSLEMLLMNFIPSSL